MVVVVQRHPLLPYPSLRSWISIINPSFALTLNNCTADYDGVAGTLSSRTHFTAFDVDVGDDADGWRTHITMEITCIPLVYYYYLHGETGTFILFAEFAFSPCTGHSAHLPLVIPQFLQPALHCKGHGDGNLGDFTCFTGNAENKEFSALLVTIWFREW